MDATDQPAATEQTKLACLAIVGPARSGKDYVREWLCNHTAHVATCCTSWAACEIVWKHWQLDHAHASTGKGSGLFSVVTPSQKVLREFWDERLSPERREYWAACMAAYNWSDGSGCRLYREMVDGGQTLLTGIRRKNELDACVSAGLVGGVVYVGGGEGCVDATCELTWNDCLAMPLPEEMTYWVSNSAKDPDDVDAQLRNMCRHMGIEVSK